jgi:hypothetical protein
VDKTLDVNYHSGVDYNSLSDQEINGLVQSRVFPYPEGRCRVCGWPLDSRRVPSCEPNNCSMRPRPSKRADEAPAYSTSLEMAWDLINEAKGLDGNDSEKLVSLVSELGLMAEAAGYSGEHLAWFIMGCPNPARAIAIAALRALDRASVFDDIQPLARQVDNLRLPR